MRGATFVLAMGVALIWLLPGVLQAKQLEATIQVAPDSATNTTSMLAEEPALEEQDLVREQFEGQVEAAPQAQIPRQVEEPVQLEAKEELQGHDEAAAEDQAQVVAVAATEHVLQQARSVDLREPVANPEDIQAIIPRPSAPVVVTGESDQTPQVETQPFILLGTEVPPMTSTRLSWSPAQSFEGLASPTSVLVVNGAKPGPTLCLTAAIHGDEINGIEIVRRVLYNIEPEDLTGAVIGVPIVNLQGFQRGSRYLPDRRDLNRYFPGAPNGSSASRIAHSFFHEVIEACTVLVDLHTGSFDRTNLPQLRADLSNPEVLELTQGFGATVVLHSEGAPGTLRQAAVNEGIPTVTIEAGGPMRLQEDAVDHSVKSIHTLLNHLGMVKKSRIWGDPEPVYYNSQWLRAETGGVLLSEVRLGEKVKSGDVLGNVTNPITNVSTTLRSPTSGRILGMALNQVVMPGYAAYHIGITADADEVPVTSKAVQEPGSDAALIAAEEEAGGLVPPTDSGLPLLEDGLDFD
jgi:predicted deacylase